MPFLLKKKKKKKYIYIYIYIFKEKANRILEGSSGYKNSKIYISVLPEVSFLLSTL